MIRQGFVVVVPRAGPACGGCWYVWAEMPPLVVRGVGDVRRGEAVSGALWWCWLVRGVCVGVVVGACGL